MEDKKSPSTSGFKQWWSVVGMWIAEEPFTLAVVSGKRSIDTTIADDELVGPMWTHQCEAVTATAASVTAENTIREDYQETLVTVVGKPASTTTRPSRLDYGGYPYGGDDYYSWSRWEKRTGPVELTRITVGEPATAGV